MRCLLAAHLRCALATLGLLLLVTACDNDPLTVSVPPPVPPPPPVTAAMDPDSAGAFFGRDILAALYGVTDGPNWADAGNWLTDAPLGDWHGVETDGRGRVTVLSLRYNALAGPIPPELENLAGLRDLWLDFNALTGPIPPELGNLAGLESLYLDVNALTGPIPPELGNLARLSRLGLSQNALTGPIPPELGNLAELSDLHLFGNALTGPIPPELGNLARLSRLNLDSNALTGPIPAELGNLAELRDLSLDSNALAGPIPAELGNLAGLETLWLDFNDLAGPIPAELGNLAELSRLHLFGNALTGPIPPELGNLAGLRYLSLSRNDLTGPIPPELGNLAELRDLWLSRNDLTGPIPPELGNLAELSRLELDSNDLTGPIPPELGNLAELSRLELDSNDLTGPIPPELGNLAELESLSLYGNALAGPIPPELGSLAELESLSLYDNALAGPIPAELGNLAGLESLLLDSNDLTGPIPAELGNLAGLETLSLSDNALTGPIPAELGNLAGLETLSLSDNALTGPIPAEFGNLAELETLHLSDNEGMVGILPTELTGLGRLEHFNTVGTGLCAPRDPAFIAWLNGVRDRQVGLCAVGEPLSDRDILAALYEVTDGPNWADAGNWLTDAPLGDWHGVETDGRGRVTVLDLSDNALAGPIPPELGNLAELESLLLSDNALAGPIPPELGNLAELESLLLSDNALAGPIPPELGNLAELSRLDLYDNDLTGPIPPEFGNLAGLRYLYLSRNALAGPIPPELGNLAGLESLWLGDNALTGPIPPELGNLAGLESLVLSGNALAGPIPPELGNLAELSGLYLSRNALAGPIPPEFGNLAGLRYLYLSRNALAGPISPELGNLAGLRYLNLSRNALTGPIPAELGNLAELSGLYLSRNALTGPIPAELGNLAELSGLNLSGNALTGPIPPELGNLAELWRLLLDSNALTGPIPPELGNLAELRHLSLTNNEGMAGILPTELTGLGRLERLRTRGTGLCAPSDPGFLAWLNGVPTSRIVLCASGGEVLAYLTQAVQSREYPVPLVAGEKALLRVFVTVASPTTTGIPPVRARLYADGNEIHVADIPARPAAIPAGVQEGDLSVSANAEIPGEVVRPGLEMVVEIDPEGTLDPGLGVARRIPETGRLAVYVRKMPVFGLTVIPFLWSADPDSAVVEAAEAMEADPEGHELLWHTRTLLPIGDLEVTAHEPVLSSSSGARGGESFRLLNETRAIRAIEGGSGHYMGMMSGPGAWGGGAAVLSGRVSYSAPSAMTMAHELGHNLNLSHAPCGGAGWPDPAFPYPDGSIGAWGYDFRHGGALVSPRRPDLMSYCGPSEWISDYHFTNALRFRLFDEGPPVAASPAAQEAESLFLWGGTDAAGAPFLNPAFVIDAARALPDSTGAHRITGRTASGGELFALGFAMPDVADGDGRSSFAFVLPVRPGWAGSLASVTLSGPGGSATLDNDTDLPMSILLDPGTGQVRGILRDPPPDAAAALAPLAGPDSPDVLFSRGIPDAAAWGR